MGRYELSIWPVLVGNNKWIFRIVVDDHIKKHPEISDEIIKELVKGLAWDDFKSVKQDPPFSYFVSFGWVEDKHYRMVWLLEDKQDYIGIVTVFRDKKVR